MYFNSIVHLGFKAGVTSNFVDAKTKKHLDNYFSILGLDGTLHIKHHYLSYYFVPTTLQRIKRTLYASNGDSVRAYRKKEGDYFANILKHNFDFGSEIRLGSKKTVTPMVRVGLRKFLVLDSSNYKKK
jgi:hypothetical protein